MLHKEEWTRARKQMCQEHGFDHHHLLPKIQDAAETLIGRIGDVEVHDVLFRVQGYGKGGVKKAYRTTIEVRRYMENDTAITA